MVFQVKKFLLNCLPDDVVQVGEEARQVAAVVVVAAPGATPEPVAAVGASTTVA